MVSSPESAIHNNVQQYQNMDQIIDKRFERVEKALATLITSISTHIPSTSSATDLVAADAELNEGLEQLTVHQANHAKLVALRATSAELDNQIRETLLLLTKTRSELIATPATNLSATTNPLSYSELLSFARRISKYTLPPSYREPDPDAPAAIADATTKDGAAQASTETGTPILAVNGANSQSQSTAMEIDNTVATAEATQETDISGVKTNTKNWSTFLGPRDDTGWTPWPSPDAIRSGALASIQILINQGADPATFDPERSAELEAERKRVMEEEDSKREEEQTKQEEAVRKERKTWMSEDGARPERVQEQPKVFQLETFDDDDDDD